MEPETPPPPPTPPPLETTVRDVVVGSGRYNVVVTCDLEMAASWVRDLPFLEPSPPVTRIVGFSDLRGDSPTENDPLFLDCIGFSFFSRVLVLQLAPLSVAAASPFPEDLHSFLVNSRNLFVGVAATPASRAMRWLYGVGPWRTLDLDLLNEVGTGQPHVVLARRLLGWPWPLSSDRHMFVAQTSVLSQLLGHFTAQRYRLPVRENPEWC